MKLGYNTNGFQNHVLDDAIEIIAELGYHTVAITLDVHTLNPYQPNLDQEIAKTSTLLDRFGLGCVIETGSRFLLDPRRKHEPTLISSDEFGRWRRLDFLKKAVDIAAILQAEAVSFWSGVKNDAVPDDRAWPWLIDGCRDLAAYAAGRNVVLAFEPEPGMFIENLAQYSRLRDRLNLDNFFLTLDIGHAFLTEPQPVESCISRFAGEIRNIHLEDMKKERHEHLLFGDGEMNFSGIFTALRDIDYRGPATVELSRHSHTAVETAQQAMTFLATQR